MSRLESAERIEGIVGVKRHPTLHYARAVSTEQTVYILHSQECKASGIDLRDCPFSVALDEGIDVDEWTEDRPVVADIVDGWRLVPVGTTEGDTE